MSLIIPANSLAGGGYAVDNSLRFDSGSPDSLTRTFTSGNQKTWTFSTWFKRSGTSAIQKLLATCGTNSDATTLEIIFVYGLLRVGRYYSTNLETTQEFRDYSAWYHIVVSVDTTQGTASDRMKIFINGNQVTAFNTASYPVLNEDTPINLSGQICNIGRQYYPHVTYADGWWEGYMAETYLIDGQALTPTDFGEFDADSGVWKPIVYEGTYGTNGFFLEFQDSGALGTDSSGEGNNFTVNNLTSIDQTTDTPTNNFATMNPLFAGDPNLTYSEGNLKLTATAENQKNAVSTIAVSSGKWYCEMVSRVGTNYPGFGIMDTGSVLQTSVSYLGSSSDSYCMFQDGNYYNNGSASSTGTSWGVGSIMGVAIDLDSGTKTIKFYKDGAEEHSATISTPANAYVFAASHNTNGTISEINFGNAPYTITTGNADANGYGNFEYAVPAGYLSLCTKNLSEVNS